MPSKRELLEEILKKMEIIELNQYEMKTSIHELKSSQHQMKHTIKALQSNHYELEESLTIIPETEEQSNSISPTYDDYSTQLNYKIIDIQTAQKLMKNSIEELTSSMKDLKTSINKEMKNSLEDLTTSIEDIQAKTNEMKKALQDEQNKDASDLNINESDGNNDQHELEELKASILVLQSSMSDIKNAIFDIQLAQQTMNTSIRDLHEKEIEIDFPQETEALVHLPSAITGLQTTMNEISKTIVFVQEEQNVSKSKVHELYTSQNHLETVIDELQNSNNEILSKQNELMNNLLEIKASKNDPSHSAETNLIDLTPIYSHFEKYNDRLNILRNYVNQLHEDIGKVFDEMDTIKGHTIKNSTLLSPINNIVPKIIQLESDMNVLKKQLNQKVLSPSIDLFKKQIDSEKANY